MTNKEVLISARGFIEKGWTQGAGARDKYECHVSAKDPDARSWCALGALDAVNPDGYIRLLEIWAYLNSLVDTSCVDEFNDYEDTTQKDVLDLYDRAITACDDV